MLNFTKRYIINVITKPEVAVHLIPNVKGFDIIYYIKEECKGAEPKDSEEKDMLKVKFLCSFDAFPKIWDYLDKYYVKDYGIVLYHQIVVTA